LIINNYFVFLHFHTMVTINAISDLFARWAGAQPNRVEPVAAAGSNRQYVRLSGSGKTAIGAYGSDIAENRAFFSIGKQLKKQGVRVPEIYAVSDDEQYYLVEDFGDISLFNLLQSRSESENLPLLQDAVAQLAYLQIKGAEGFDFAACYPVAAFDRTSIFWDLNYFKYCFLKPQGVDINEVLLERDFDRLATHLLEADAHYFMYRDFQSRNIMLHNGALGFIDFQGGRRGPLQYDLASFLFQAKSRFSETLREQLLQHYIEAASKLMAFDAATFLRYYYSFVLFRTLQVLGAYGFRGLIEHKPHFTESIPYALQNIRWLLDSGKLNGLQIPYILEILNNLTIVATANNSQFSILNSQFVIVVSSFSYRNGYPEDTSEHGGGYVFDCRGLKNPGILPELREFTGKDPCIIDYLEKQSAVERFLQPAFSMVSLSVDNYLERGFTYLSVAFGCTGGRHRSVYCAERMAAYLKAKYPNVQVVTKHREHPTI